MNPDDSYCRLEPKKWAKILNLLTIKAFKSESEIFMERPALAKQFDVDEYALNNQIIAKRNNNRKFPFNFELIPEDRGRPVMYRIERNDYTYRFIDSRFPTGLPE